MVSSTELRDSESEVVSRQQTLSDVMLMIESLCVQNGLSYQHHAPIQVSPGVWMFYAVDRDYNCTQFGSCRQRQHFAIDVGGRLRLA